jgi:hypothetical protein
MLNAVQSLSTTIDKENQEASASVVVSHTLPSLALTTTTWSLTYRSISATSIAHLLSNRHFRNPTFN